MRRVGQVRRRDSNEQPIVDALEALGAQVTRISGKGAPDLLIRYQGRLLAVEVKNPKGRNRVTDAQTETQWPIVRSVAEALHAVGVNP